VIKQVKHLVALERNALAYDTVTLSAVTQSSTGTVVYLAPSLPASIVSLPQVASGDNLSYKLAYNWFDFRATFTMAGTSSETTTATTILFRYMIVQDWANKGANPAVTDILYAADINSPLNQLNKKRFTVKYDKIIRVPVDAVLYDSSGFTRVVMGNQIHVHKRIKLSKNKAIEYIGAAGTVADAQKGQLFQVCLTDNLSSGQTPTPQMQSIYQLCYEAI